MSEYTTRQILDMIEANGGPEGLDLSQSDLSEIDLGSDRIQAELDRVRKDQPEVEPPWWSRGFVSGEGGINLRRANLEGAHLRLAEMQGADLVGANLEGARLMLAQMQESRLRGANLAGASLRYANLEHASLRHADLKGARLSHANLGRAFLGGVDLKGADLDGANLEGTFLVEADLSRVDLRNAESIEGISLYRARLDHTQLTRDQLGEAVGEERGGEWFEARQTYLALKNNFQELGRYDDARWAYRKERRMEKRDAWQKTRTALRERRWGGAVGNGLRAASDQLVELVCDYGEGLSRVLASLLLLWLVFALSYGLIGGVWGPPQETSGGPVRYATRNPLHLLAFSLGAMTTLQPAGLEARPTQVMQFLMPIQALLGIVLAGLFGFVLGNRIRRS
ncbi:MAG: pentapeptide repeat-containing protein [Chloroflexota bacterium]